MERYIATLESPEQTARAIGEVMALGRFGRPEDVAYTALYLASDESAFITGAVL